MNQQPKPKPNWWDRNWKWIVPAGCLTIFIAFTLFVTAIVSLVMGVMKSSDAYKIPLARARTHAEVQKAIGAPIKDGFFVTGNINVSGHSGQADISIPISGPDGKATVYVIAAKSTGRWNFKTLVVEIKQTGKRINLLE